jgi:hypothetical protein
MDMVIDDFGVVDSERLCLSESTTSMHVVEVSLVVERAGVWSKALRTSLAMVNTAADVVMLTKRLVQSIEQLEGMLVLMSLGSSWKTGSSSKTGPLSLSSSKATNVVVQTIHRTIERCITIEVARLNINFHGHNNSTGRVESGLPGQQKHLEWLT